MDIKFDFETRQMIVADRGYSLDKLEEFILKYWYPLAKRYALRPIQSNGQTLYTYDWKEIFQVAVAGGIILEEFLDRQGALYTNKKKPLQQIGLFE